MAACNFVTFERNSFVTLNYGIECLYVVCINSDCENH